MAKKLRTGQRETLASSPIRCEPEDLLSFVEAHGFSRDWDHLRLGIDDLVALQLTIMVNPKAGDVVAGTGGLRKLRFAPPAWRLGKRSGIRVCYVYFEEFGIVLLVIAYPKSAKDDLTAAEKKALRHMIDEQRKVFSNRLVRPGGVR